MERQYQGYVEATGMGTTLPVLFIWHQNDALAVTLIIGNGMEDAIPWTFAVDLLREGVVESAGYGDVIVWSGDSQTSILLRSPSGTATIKFGKKDIEEFLSYVPADLTYEVDDDELFALLDNGDVW